MVARSCSRETDDPADKYQSTRADVLPSRRVRRLGLFAVPWMLSVGLLFAAPACKQYRVAPFDGASSDGDSNGDVSTNSRIYDGGIGESGDVDSAKAVDANTEAMAADGGAVTDATVDANGADVIGQDGGGPSDRFGGDAGGVGAICGSGSDCQSGCCEPHMFTPSTCEPRGFCIDTCVMNGQVCTSNDECCSGKCTSGPMPPNSCISL